MGQEGDNAFLERAKTAFDFPFGLGSWRDKVDHAKPKQSALELAFWIAVVVAGAWSEEAQGVGQAMGLEGGAEVAEVIPGRLGGDETARHIEAGMVIDSEQQDLFEGGRPPLVDGTVVLIKFADPGTTKTAAGALFARGSGDEMGEMRFDMNPDAGSRPLETAETLHFVGHEMVVGRVLQWQEVFEKGADFWGPSVATSAAAGSGLAGLPVAQVVGSELIESGSADAKMRGGSRGIKYPTIKIGENAEDKMRRQAMNDLFLFTGQEDGDERGDSGDQKEVGFLAVLAERGIFRRINAASPLASATLRSPPRLHLCGSQLEYAPQPENSSFAQAPTSRIAEEGSGNFGFSVDLPEPICVNLRSYSVYDQI